MATADAIAFFGDTLVSLLQSGLVGLSVSDQYFLSTPERIQGFSAAPAGCHDLSVSRAASTARCATRLAARFAGGAIQRAAVAARAALPDHAVDAGYARRLPHRRRHRAGAQRPRGAALRRLAGRRRLGSRRHRRAHPRVAARRGALRHLGAHRPTVSTFAHLPRPAHRHRLGGRDQRAAGGGGDTSEKVVP